MNTGLATLARAVETRGIGLHSGEPVLLRLVPRELPGWVFVRTDLAGAPEIAASLENVVSTTHATVLRNGVASVSTTEHLLAALWASDITHARIELDGPEVPILDGSAKNWCELLQQAGREKLAGERAIYGLNAPVWMENQGATVLGLPHENFRVSVAVDFGHEFAGAQTWDGAINHENFITELAAARTFTLESWLEPLRAQNLIRGGSLENAVVIGENGPSSDWRMPHEIARHKALDVVGDLALMFGKDGGALRGHVIAVRGGHGAHRNWMLKCRAQQALRRLN